MLGITRARLYKYLSEGGQSLLHCSASTSQSAAACHGNVLQCGANIYVAIQIFTSTTIYQYKYLPLQISTSTTIYQYNYLTWKYIQQHSMFDTAQNCVLHTLSRRVDNCTFYHCNLGTPLYKCKYQTPLYSDSIEGR